VSNVLPDDMPRRDDIPTAMSGEATNDALRAEIAVHRAENAALIANPYPTSEIVSNSFAYARTIAEFERRFNRRLDLATMMPWLAHTSDAPPTAQARRPYPGPE
jgi:hypothetical protein